MSSRDYSFVTHWQAFGTPEEVFRILEDPRELPRWWPSVYLAARELEPGGADGIGRVVFLVTRGWLPYRLRWRLRVVRARRPFELEVEAWGDLTGRGVWTLEPQGSSVAIRFEWTVEARKPLLRALSPLFAPALGANHRWAMARGEVSLQRELARRRAASPAERDRIEPPPGPVRHSGLVLAAGSALLLGSIVAVARSARRRARRGFPAR